MLITAMCASAHIKKTLIQVESEYNAAAQGGSTRIDWMMKM